MPRLKLWSTLLLAALAFLLVSGTASLVLSAFGAPKETKSKPAPPSVPAASPAPAHPSPPAPPAHPSPPAPPTVPPATPPVSLPLQAAPAPEAPPPAPPPPPPSAPAPKPASVVEPAPELAPVVESAPEPAPTTTTEPTPTPDPAPAPAPKPASVVEPAPEEPETTSSSSLAVESTPTSSTETTPTSVHEGSSFASAPELEPELELELEPVSTSESSPELEPESSEQQLQGSASAPESESAHISEEPAPEPTQESVSTPTHASATVDFSPPELPTTIKLSTNGRFVKITWSDPLDSDVTRIEILRNAGGHSPVSGVPLAYVTKGRESFVDYTVISGQTYKYQLRSSDIFSTTKITTEYAVKIQSPVLSTAASRKNSTILPDTGSSASQLSAGAASTVKQHSLTVENFVEQGTDATKFLSLRERTGVIESYRAAFGRLPEIKEEWKDIERISRGSFPQARKIEIEDWAMQTFAITFNRSVDIFDPADLRAIMIMAYGLLPQPRDLSLESSAVEKFYTLTQRLPSESFEWNIVRALAYSGISQ